MLADKSNLLVITSLTSEGPSPKGKNCAIALYSGPWPSALCSLAATRRPSNTVPCFRRS